MHVLDQSIALGLSAPNDVLHAPKRLRWLPTRRPTAWAHHCPEPLGPRDGPASSAWQELMRTDDVLCRVPRRLSETAFLGLRFLPPPRGGPGWPRQSAHAGLIVPGETGGPAPTRAARCAGSKGVFLGAVGLPGPPAVAAWPAVCPFPALVSVRRGAGSRNRPLAALATGGQRSFPQGAGFRGAGCAGAPFSSPAWKTSWPPGRPV
jgi:hypothetical protein